MLRNFVDTIDVVDDRWGPPLVDEDWHRREETEEKFNKEAKQGWRTSADAVRITGENAGNAEGKHTSGRSLGVKRQWLCVVDKRQGAVVSIPGNEGRIARRMGERQRRYADFCSVFLAFRRMDTKA